MCTDPMTLPSAFVSYAREDLARVRPLVRFLESCRVTPWLDVDRILPGEKWDDRIKGALGDADFVILCLSEHSVSKRGYVQRELRAALDMMNEYLDSDIYLIPVLLERCEIPRSLDELQWVEFFSPKGPQRLREALQEGARRRGLSPDSGGQGAEPDDLPAPDLSGLGGATALSSFSLKKLFGRRRDGK